MEEEFIMLIYWDFFLDVFRSSFRFESIRTQGKGHLVDRHARDKGTVRETYQTTPEYSAHFIAYPNYHKLGLMLSKINLLYLTIHFFLQILFLKITWELNRGITWGFKVGTSKWTELKGSGDFSDSLAAF